MGKLARPACAGGIIGQSPVIRADIKSFYRSIPHFKLLQDIRKYYNDPKLQAMLENIITNPIETPRGYKNPGTGIALRGPLSQFFSGLYLKPLDDAFDKKDVSYFRFQDDVLILCKTKRQLTRCRQVMMAVLHERHLTLSRKKSRMGRINLGFHFLGIDYPPTRPEDITKVKHSSNDRIITPNVASYLDINGGGVATSGQVQNELSRIAPHARTLRKARMQVQLMVALGVSTRKIKKYLHRYFLWWVNTANWSYEYLIKQFIAVCWDLTPAAYAAGLLIRHIKKSDSLTPDDLLPAGKGLLVAAIAA